jgi:hypothetical protein
MRILLFVFLLLPSIVFAQVHGADAGAAMSGQQCLGVVNEAEPLLMHKGMAPGVSLP